MAKARTRSLVEAGRPSLLYLDANVLIPATLRAIFLDLAEAGLAQVHWSEQVLAEVRRNLVKPKFGLPSKLVDKLFGHMGSSFPDALVTADALLEKQFAGKTDAKDVHVAAGAYALTLPPYNGDAAVLVTSNLRHFPDSAFTGKNVRAAHPGAVLKSLLAAEPGVPDILDAMLRRFGKPPISREDLLDSLVRAKCGAFATKLAETWGLKPES